MKIVVKDANVLIDFANGDLVESWFSLNYQTWTTDLVLAQVRRADQWERIRPHVNSGILQVYKITDEILGEIIRLPFVRRVGLADASAVFLARELNGILLTGDRRLRKDGAKLGVEVHGVLWAIDLFIKEEILDATEAAERLENILSKGSLLPPGECERRINKWRRSK